MENIGLVILFGLGSIFEQTGLQYATKQDVINGIALGLAIALIIVYTVERIDKKQG